LALTTDNSDKIQSPKTIKQIREIAYTTEIKNEAKNAEDKNLILKLYGQNDNINDHSPLRMIITRVRKWLEFSPITNPSGLPPVLRTSIAIGSPDVFLLIMWFAKKDIDSPISISKEQIIAIATILHWFTFSEKAKSNVVNQIYSKCKSEVSIRNISAALFDSVQKCYLHKIYNPQDIRKAISVEFNREWRWEQFINKPFWDFICKLRWNRELILYAQRRYLAEKFQDYDPSRPDLWEEHNRPWDMDHIVPQNWIVGKQGEWREFCYQWLNNNGNFAAISFEINRSKSDEASWSEYIRNASLLLFDDIKEATINSINSGITYKKEISETFAGIVLNRFFKIIESWYNGLEIGKLFLPYKDITCSRTAQRQQIFLSIKNRLNGIAKLYYVKNNKEIPFIDQAQWEFCESWIILGIPISDKYLISIASDCNKIEIGIRKHPDSGKTNSEDFEFLKRKLSNYRGTFEPKYLLRNDWWYYLYGFDFNDDNFASKNEDKYSSELQDFYDLLKE